MSLDNGLTTSNVGTLYLDWFIEAICYCKEGIAWARLLMVALVEGLKSDMLDWEGGIILLNEGGVTLLKNGGAWE